MLKKISGPLGSTEGGWYQDSETDVFYYVKFYKNETTAQLEYFANLVYQKLGVFVPEKTLDPIDGRLAVVSKKIGEGVRATKEEQQDHPDLVRGFVADAYLNNWDVVGEFFDNIVKDEAGHLYRVDNGGTGPVRANEGRKHFSVDAIPEIDDMRNRKFQAGYVFGNVTNEMIASQAQQFLAQVSEAFITDAIAGLDLAPAGRAEVLNGFLGRLFCLSEKYAKTRSA